MEIYSEKLSTKYMIIEWILTLLIYSVVLLLTSKIFNGFYVENFIYALITSIIIMILNKRVKPLLKILALPITTITLGISYPFIDVIILKLASLIMGSHFVVNGWFVPFFIAIFISIMTVLLDAIITKVIVRRR